MQLQAFFSNYKICLSHYFFQLLTSLPILVSVSYFKSINSVKDCKKYLELFFFPEKVVGLDLPYKEKPEDTSPLKYGFQERIF